MDEARGSRMVAEMNLVYEDAFNMLCGDLLDEGRGVEITGRCAMVCTTTEKRVE